MARNARDIASVSGGNKADDRRGRANTADDATPDEDALLTAIGDEGCRRLLGHLVERERPQTAKELSSDCEMPSSTVYRKLETLVEAGLIEEHTRINTRGKHPDEYVPRVDRVTIDIADMTVRTFPAGGRHEGPTGTDSHPEAHPARAVARGPDD